MSQSSEGLLKPLPGLEYLEQLKEEEPTQSLDSMIVENHGSKEGLKAQKKAENAQKPWNRLVQREVKHGLSDPHTQEDKHLDQEEVQGPEHMVMEDHGPKKGMAPRLKPQMMPLFFPFATCLPTASALPREYKGTEQDQSLPLSTALNTTESSIQDSLIINTEPTKLTHWELKSLWPNQWQSEEQENCITAQGDSGLDPEGTELRDDPPDWEETKDTNDTPDTILWELIEKPRWISELDNTSELEPEEDPSPLRMQHQGYESKLEGELSPHKSNDKSGRQEMLSLQTWNKCKPQINDHSIKRSLMNKASSLTSDDKEGTTDPEQSQPQNMITQQWSNMQQCDSKRSLIQTSTHYSKISKPNDQTPND